MLEAVALPTGSCESHCLTGLEFEFSNDLTNGEAVAQFEKDVHVIGHDRAAEKAQVGGFFERMDDGDQRRSAGWRYQACGGAYSGAGDPIACTG